MGIFRRLEFLISSQGWALDLIWWIWVMQNAIFDYLSFWWLWLYSHLKNRVWLEMIRVPISSLWVHVCVSLLFTLLTHHTSWALLRLIPHGWSRSCPSDSSSRHGRRRVSGSRRWGLGLKGEECFAQRSPRQTPPFISQNDSCLNSKWLEIIHESMRWECAMNLKSSHRLNDSQLDSWLSDWSTSL